MVPHRSPGTPGGNASAGDGIDRGLDSIAKAKVVQRYLNDFLVSIISLRLCIYLNDFSVKIQGRSFLALTETITIDSRNLLIIYTFGNYPKS